MHKNMERVIERYGGKQIARTEARESIRTVVET